MKKISILVPQSSVMQAVADPQYLFTAVNQFLIVAGKPALFDVELVGAKKEVKLNDGMYSIHTNRQLKDVRKTDLVIIPALFGDMKTAVAKNKNLVPWIQQQYNNKKFNLKGSWLGLAIIAHKKTRSQIVILKNIICSNAYFALYTIA